MNEIMSILVKVFDIPKSANAVFNEIVDEMTNSLIIEATEHFLSVRTFSIKDDPRYFYTNNEMRMFFKSYISKGGNISDLRVNNVYDDQGEFLCYEICRVKHWKQLFESVSSPYCGSEQANITMFLPAV